MDAAEILTRLRIDEGYPRSARYDPVPLMEHVMGPNPLPLMEHMALPFAEEYFDAVVSVDAYHYFGTDPGYLAEILRFLSPGGRIGHVSPGLSREVPVEAWPTHLVKFVEEGFEIFHSAGWCRELWEATGLVTVDHAQFMPGGADLWLRWAETWDAWAAQTPGREPYRKEAAMLRDDVDGLLGFVAVIATKQR